MNKDQAKGRIEEAKGKVKEVAGKLVGNETLEAKRQGSKSRRQGPGGLRRSQGCLEERQLSWMNSGSYCSEEALNGKKLNRVAVASASFADVVSI